MLVLMYPSYHMLFMSSLLCTVFCALRSFYPELNIVVVFFNSVFV